MYPLFLQVQISAFINIMAEPHRKLLVEKGLVTQQNAERYCRAWEEWEAT